MTNGSLLKVKGIAECSPWNILQYFWPALSNNRSWKPIFCLFESGCFTVKGETTLTKLAPSPYFFVKSISLVYINMFSRFDEIPAMTL